MAATPKLLLASASPRRCELLRQIGVQFKLIRHHVTEIREPGEAPLVYVQRMAKEKALSACSGVPRGSEFAVLAADTIVVVDDRVLGKPSGREDALSMLRTLSGRTHLVMTAVAVTDGARTGQALSVSEVEFRPLRDAELIRYWETGEAVDKAGSYAIQGRAGIFVRHLSGSYSGVVGLPLCETANLLADFGIGCWQQSGDYGADQQ